MVDKTTPEILSAISEGFWISCLSPIKEDNFWLHGLIKQAVFFNANNIVNTTTGTVFEPAATNQRPHYHRNNMPYPEIVGRSRNVVKLRSKSSSAFHSIKAGRWNRVRNRFSYTKTQRNTPMRDTTVPKMCRPLLNSVSVVCNVRF